MIDNKNELKIIDFSDGIRSSEIDHNFTALQSQIEEERISVAGQGIADGFIFNLDKFNLEISEGSFISKTGERVYVNSSAVTISKPVLINKIETLKTVDKDLRVFLKDKPYASNRLHTSDMLEDFTLEKSGVTIQKSGQAGDTSKVSISNISSKVIILSGINGVEYGTKVDVNYNYTHKRRDVVFINTKHEVEYRTGLTSPSPSVPDVSEDDCLYTLGYIEIDGHAILDESTGKKGAKAKIIKEFKSIRNVYTDSDNNLYLCGTPFSAIKTINMTEPRNPQEGTFWYDMYTNKLKVWRHTDTFTYSDIKEFTSSNPDADFTVETGIEYLCNQGQLKVYINRTELSKYDFVEGTDFTEEERLKGLVYSKEFTITKRLNTGDKVGYRIERYDGFAEWVAISDSTYIPVREHLIYTPEIMENYTIDKLFNKQHFMFHSDENRNMMFVPNTNALTIMIDQVPLHKDQYSEITLKDAIAGEESPMINKVLSEFYGYTGDMSTDIMNENYENIGVGFRLSKPLLRNSYVEAIVEHRINTNPISKRFQRSATFIADGVFNYEKYIETQQGTEIKSPLFETSISFKFEECQLEVFINGRKLIRDIDFKEIAKENSLRGEMINQFEILEAAGLNSGDNIEYKVTTSIYSYDHLSTIFENYEKTLTLMDKRLETAIDNMENSTEAIDEKIKVVDEQIERLSNIEENLENSFMHKDAKIGKNNLDVALYTGIAQECFYENLQVTSLNQKINISNICNNKDFVSIVNISQNNGNKILRRDIEFTIEADGVFTFLNIETESVAIGSFLYLSGIKFRRA